MVILCLLSYHVYAWLSKDFDRSIMTSVQSRIARQIEYAAFLNRFGKFCWIASLGSQTTRECSNNWHSNFIQVTNVRKHNAGDIQNLSAKSSLSIPKRSFMRVYKNSCLCVNFFGLSMTECFIIFVEVTLCFASAVK